MNEELKEYDAFICYASEDKDLVARPLAERLSGSFKLKIWFDEFSLEVGDSLRKSIDYGLANSEAGIVILSKSFFSKSWPQKELGALIEGNILPIWHKVTKKDVKTFSPMVAAIFALNTEDGMDILARGIAAKITGNPLLGEYAYIDRRQRRRMVDALGELGNEAVPPLIRLTRDDDLYVRERAVIALGKIADPQAIPSIIALLDDEFEDVRAAARRVLLDQRNAALNYLIVALRNNQSEIIRSAAAELLGDIEDPASVEALEIALNDESLRVQLTALGILRKRHDPRIDLVIQQWEHKHPKPFDFFAQKESVTSEKLQTDVGSKKALIKKIDAEDLQLANLVECLKDKFNPIRIFAVEFLGWSRAAKAVSPLVAVLEDEHSTVRNYAVEALGQIGDLDALAPLVASLKDDDPTVRQEAAVSLAELRDPVVVDALKEALKDTDSDVRAKAVTALGLTGGIETVESLIETLKDEDNGVRSNAVKMLGYLGDDRGITPLLEMLKNDKDSSVRWLVGGMLRIILKKHGIDF